MVRFLQVIFSPALLVVLASAVAAFASADDLPLILTPYITAGRISEARELARVQAYENILPSSIESYAAYLTVNASSNGNLFFWFFSCENSSLTNAPVVLWLNGGPGASSLGGLFTELGPLALHYNSDNKTWTVDVREWRWTRFAHVLFVDQPVGTGFSFTSTDDGYARDETQIGENMYTLFAQFYQLFPELAQNPLYITGESYAGKYLPAIGAAIDQHNTINNSTKIPLEGMAIGDGWMHPALQAQAYADFFYNIGMLDARQTLQVQALANVSLQLFNSGDLIGSNNAAEAIINDDYEFPIKSLFWNFTHHDNVYNILNTSFAPESYLFYLYVQQPTVAQWLHVGPNITFGANTDKVGNFLEMDFVANIEPKLLTVMAKYRTMIYNGQLDALCGVQFAQKMLQELTDEQWPDRTNWWQAKKQIWRVQNADDEEVAGYVKQVEDRFYQVVVRGAGHLAPMDQPRRLYDMMERFVNNKPFS